MDEQISWAISYVAIYSMFLPAVVGAWFFRRLDYKQRLIFYLIAITVLVEAIAFVIDLQDGPKSLIYNFFTVAEFFLLSRLYKLVVPPVLPRSFFDITVVIIIGATIAELLWLNSLQIFNGITTTLESLFLIFFVLCYFYKTMQELKIKNLEREPAIIVSIGVLLYFSSSLFVFLFTNYVDGSTETLFLIWGIHGIFSLILNIFYAIALWLRPA